MGVAAHENGDAWEWRYMGVAVHGSNGAWSTPSFCQTHPSVNPHPLATSTLLQTHPLKRHPSGNPILLATPSLG